MTESRTNCSAIVKTDKPRLIVLDDSPDWGKFVSEVAEKVGFSSNAATSYDDYAEIAKSESPAVLVLDLFMPEKDGIEIILDLGSSTENRPFILLISGQSKSFLESAVTLARGKGLEVIGALEKPFRLRELKAMLQNAAGLVERKKMLGNKIRAMNSTQRTKATPFNMAIDHDHAAAQNLRNLENIIGFPATENSLRRSIAEINAQFCFMLWDTQLATLNTLNIIPGRLVEAAADLIASIASAEETSSWHEALSLHTQTLVDNQAAIREIANSLRLPKHGRSATESIVCISTIASEIQAAKRTKNASNTGMLASFRKLCNENNRLKENLEALLSAVNSALALAHDAAVSRSVRVPIQSQATSPRNHQNKALQQVGNSRILEG